MELGGCARGASPASSNAVVPYVGRAADDAPAVVGEHPTLSPAVAAALAHAAKANAAAAAAWGCNMLLRWPLRDTRRKNRRIWLESGSSTKRRAMVVTSMGWEHDEGLEGNETVWESHLVR